MIRSRQFQIRAILLVTVLIVSATLVTGYLSLPQQPAGQTPLGVDISVIGEIDTGGNALRVHLEGNLAFVIDFGNQESYGLIIVNVSDPSQPEIVGTFHDGGLPFAIESTGDIVYIADQVVGLRIINISDVSNPIQIDGYSGSGTAYDLEIAGDLLFLGDNAYGMVILNISTPSEPVFVSSYGSRCIHLDIEGDMAYITGQGGLTLVDVSDPIHPTYTDQFSDGSGIWDPSVSNGIVYTGNHDGGDGELLIFDATDSSDLEKITEFDSEGTFQSFSIQDSILYAVDFEYGLYLLDVSNTSLPIEVVRFYDGGRPWDVAHNEDFVYLCGSEGLQILQVNFE